MIKNLYGKGHPVLSFEVFPPKKDDEFPKAFETLDELSKLNPDFISVTYGAGGSKSKKTIEIASYIQNQLNINALAHLTCVGVKKDDLITVCSDLKNSGISHILALRGDRPQTMTDEQFLSREFFYASDMVAFLTENTDFHIAGACYPEKHFEALNLETDLLHLKDKCEKGVDFLITQLFFDNNLFYRFREKALAQGITLPISVGIMPITTAKQLGTTVSLSGSSVPKELADIIAAYGDNKEDMRKAGIEYAARQIQDLKKNGADGIHIYTMNKAKTASDILAALQ